MLPDKELPYFVPNLAKWQEKRDEIVNTRDNKGEDIKPMFAHARKVVRRGRRMTHSLALDWGGYRRNEFVPMATWITQRAPEGPPLVLSDCEVALPGGQRFEDFLDHAECASDRLGGYLRSSMNRRANRDRRAKNGLR